MKYNFDEVIDRKGTHAVKVERLPKGADKDSLSLWIVFFMLRTLDRGYGFCLRRTDLKGSP